MEDVGSVLSTSPTMLVLLPSWGLLAYLTNPHVASFYIPPPSIILLWLIPCFRPNLPPWPHPSSLPLPPRSRISLRPKLPLSIFVVTHCLGHKKAIPFPTCKCQPDRPPTITSPPTLLSSNPECTPLTTKWCPTPPGPIGVMTTFLGALNISQPP